MERSRRGAGTLRAEPQPRHVGGGIGGLLHRLLRQERGVAALEFAFIAPIFLVLVLGVIEFGRAMYIRDAVSNAAREGARYAVVRGATAAAPATVGDIETYVRTRVPGLDADRLDVTANFTPDNQPGSAVSIQARYQHALLIPMPGLAPLTFLGESQLTVVR